MRFSITSTVNHDLGLCRYSSHTDQLTCKIYALRADLSAVGLYVNEAMLLFKKAVAY